MMSKRSLSRRTGRPMRSELDRRVDGYDLGLLDAADDLVEGLRTVLPARLATAPTAAVQHQLFDILESMPPAEGLSFAQALRKIARAGHQLRRHPTVGRIAQAALPAAGAAVGTAYGGPAGMAIGSRIGQVAGSAFPGKRPKSPPRPTRPASRTVPPRKAAPSFRKAALSSGKAASPSRNQASGSRAPSKAAAQLLTLIQNPDLLKSLTALSLGTRGRTTVDVGARGPTVPVGALVELLATFSRRAAEAAEALYSDRRTAQSRPAGEEIVVAPHPKRARRAERLYAVLLRDEAEAWTEAEAVRGLRFGRHVPANPREASPQALIPHTHLKRTR